MARLIDATRIEQYILNNCSDNEEINAIYGEIINAPTIEAIPVEWIEKQKSDCVTFSIPWVVLEALLATWEEEKSEVKA